MTRQENPREDLLAEATALVERAELEIAGGAEPVVVGFRAGGATSIFFGQDAAYHFDAANRLRRAYVAGLLFKADRGRLASLARRRTEREVQLIRHDLTDAEQESFLAELHERIARLRQALAGGAARWLRQVPPDANVPSRIVTWLTALPQPIELARSPRVG